MNEVGKTVSKFFGPMDGSGVIVGSFGLHAVTSSVKISAGTIKKVRCKVFSIELINHYYWHIGISFCDSRIAAVVVNSCPSLA